MKKDLVLPIRYAAAATALGALFLPEARWKESISVVQLAVEAALVVLAFYLAPRSHWSWKTAVAALLAGDLLFNLQFRLDFSAWWLFPAEGVVFTAYVTALAAYLARPYGEETRLEPAERRFLALVALVCLFVSVRYVLLPYVQSGNHGGALNYFLGTAFRTVQAVAIALAFTLGLKANSAYWLLLTHGVLLLSLTSVALGYNEGVMMGQTATFHEYGWLWGLLLLVAAQTWPEKAGSGAWSRWDGIRVRLAMIIFLFNAALVGLLFGLKILIVRDAYQATSLLFIIYALWSVSNLIALQVARNIKKMMDGINAGPDAAEPAPSMLDVHEIGRFAVLLREAYAKIRLQSSLAAIGQTAAMLAHDVRRPFAMTKALLGSLGGFKDDPAELERARLAIDGAITHADSMISDVLDFSREAGAELRPESLPAILEASVGLAAHASPAPGVGIRWALRHSRKPLADAARLSRALANIFGNAAEALTRAGGEAKGTISVDSGDGRDTVELSIANDGPPVPEENLPRLFEFFFTGNKARGTGLGLAAVKRIVETHGGSVSAANLPGGAGVKFTVSLPASPETEPAAGPLPPDLSRPELPGRRAGTSARGGPGAGRRVVLACDDDELARKCIAIEFRRLEEEGAETRVFSRAEDLLEFLRRDPERSPPTAYAVFTDQNMGGISGLELAAAVKSLRLPDCRVFLVSGEPEEEFSRRALDAGADAYFEGPLDSGIITAALG
ncbi:MAG: sensor protein [Elusimicrobia bacterium]|nr:MAG: sensor protein [Elusimicrobiota bacterium]KAF0156096.1 MAG: sensor protein [Elusimicrobiota bacterium]